MKNKNGESIHEAERQRPAAETALLPPFGAGSRLVRDGWKRWEYRKSARESRDGDGQPVFTVAAGRGACF